MSPRARCEAAATRTEEVHQTLSDLLPVLRVPYYRFNPQVPIMSLDETQPHKLRELQAIGRAHVTSGQGHADCESLANLLTTGRGRAGVGGDAKALGQNGAEVGVCSARLGG